MRVLNPLKPMSGRIVKNIIGKDINSRNRILIDIPDKEYFEDVKRRLLQAKDKDELFYIYEVDISDVDSGSSFASANTPYNKELLRIYKQRMKQLKR